MSFMHLFESGDFAPELIGFDDDGVEIRIMKVGGGTLGRRYSESGEGWLVEFYSSALGAAHVEMTASGTHWDILLDVVNNRRL